MKHHASKSSNRPGIVTVFIVANTLFGTMWMVTVAFHVAFGILGITGIGDHDALMIGISAAAATLGISSGVALMKDKKPGVPLAIAFSVLLLCFEGLVLYENEFRPVIDSLISLYAIVSAGYFVNGFLSKGEVPKSITDSVEPKMEERNSAPRRLADDREPSPP